MSREWIKDRLKDLKKTQVGLAKKLNLPHARISEMINGKRSLKLIEAPAFAEYMKMSIEEVMSRFGLEYLQPTGHITVKVEGYVQAGYFGEANEMHLGDEDVMYGSLKHPDAFCLIVRGDSMNIRYKEGTKLICTPFHGSPDDIKPGRAVIVEAISMDDTIETTVKEFYKDETGKYWLIPRSKNPIYQNYPVPNGQDLDVEINGHKIKDINIKAIVVSYQYDEE